MIILIYYDISDYSDYWLGIKKKPQVHNFDTKLVSIIIILVYLWKQFFEHVGIKLLLFF